MSTNDFGKQFKKIWLDQIDARGIYLNKSENYLSLLEQDLILSLKKTKITKKDNKIEQVGDSDILNRRIDYLLENDIVDLLSLNKKKLTDLWQNGLELILKNKVCVVLLSGGQSTRLGFDGPKGIFKIGLPSGKTLFELYTDQLIKLQSLAENMKNCNETASIPVYIMASFETFDKTEAFFRENKNFGLSVVKIFKQNDIPCFTPSGELIFNNDSEVVFSPNGNGDVFSTLYKSGILSEMRQADIRFVHIMNIDNVTARVCDPVFTALADISKTDILLKAIPVV